MSVDVISFSAHADFRQTSGFVEALDPAHVILVHGEAVEMGRLRKELEKQADTAGRKCTLYTPKVGQPVHITHLPQHTLRVGRPRSLALCSVPSATDWDSFRHPEAMRSWDTRKMWPGGLANCCMRCLPLPFSCGGAGLVT